MNSAHAEDADLWEGIVQAASTAEMWPDTSQPADTSHRDMTGCFALPSIFIPALVVCAVVSVLAWISMLTGGHRATGQFTHRWCVMGHLTESMQQMQEQAVNDEEEHWKAVASPEKRARDGTDEEFTNVLDDTVDDDLHMSRDFAGGGATPQTPSAGNHRTAAAKSASTAPLMAPARLLPGSPLQPALPSDFVGLAHRVWAAPLDWLKLAVDEVVAGCVFSCLVLTLFGELLVPHVQWLVDHAPRVLTAQQWQLQLSMRDASAFGGHPPASLAAVMHLCSSMATVCFMVLWLSIASTLRRNLLALRLSAPWGVDTVLFGMPLAAEKAQVNWGAKPITKPVATVGEDPVSPSGPQPPGAFAPASLGLDVGQVDGFSVRFSAATAAPAGTLVSYLTGWSARGVRATLLSEGLWRPDAKGGALKTGTSFRAAASGLLPTGADTASAECILAWSHRMRDGQLALYAGAVRAVAAPPATVCPGGAQAGSRMRQGAVTHALAQNIPVVTPAAAAHGTAGVVTGSQPATRILHAVSPPAGPYLPHVTAADVGSGTPASLLGRSLMWQDWGMAMQRNSFDLAEVLGDASGNRLCALVWSGSATLDALSLALQAAAVDEEAPSAASSKSILSMGGGVSPHAPDFVATFVRSLSAYDPVTSQARWLVGGQTAASTRARATALVSNLPDASGTPGRTGGARSRSPRSSTAMRAVSLLSPDGHMNASRRSSAHDRSDIRHNSSRLNTTGLANVTGFNTTAGAGMNTTLLRGVNASRLSHADGAASSSGVAYLAVEPASAFDYVQQTAAVPGSGLSAQEGVMLCEVSQSMSAEDMSLLLAPDTTSDGNFSLDSTSARLTRSMAWSAVTSPSTLGGSTLASTLSATAATGEMAVSESSLLLRLAALSVQDEQPGAKYGLLGRVARLFIRSPAQERAALLWDGENARHAASTLVALCCKGQKKDKSGELQRHLCVVVASVATLYASARTFALSRACAGADGIAAERLAVMGAARLDGSFQVMGSNPARALRRARIVMASLAYRQPLLLSILLQMRSNLVQLYSAWGDLLLDPAVCPLPPLPRVVLAHVRADVKNGMPMGVELSELLD